MTRTALVTGSAGFIGFHTCARLLDDGWRVIGIDAMTDYYDVALKEARLAHLLPRDGFTEVRARIEVPGVLHDLFATHRPEAVIHLAAQAGVRHSIDNPESYVEANLIGTFRLLEAMRAFPPAHSLLASTSSAYGANTRMPYAENMKTDHPMSFYAATKKANEVMAHSYAHLYRLPVTMFRFFTVYGPWGRPDMAMWIFTEAMLAGRTIKVFNHGDMRRDFTFVDDIVQGLYGAMFAPGLDPYEIFNLGNHRSENLMDMIGLLAKTLGVEPKMELLPMQDGDVPATYADVAKAKTKLGFEPTTPIAAGIPAFVEWYRQYHGL